MAISVPGAEMVPGVGRVFPGRGQRFLGIAGPFLGIFRAIRRPLWGGGHQHLPRAFSLEIQLLEGPNSW